MSLANMLTDTKVIRVMNAQAAGTSQLTSSVVNLQGFDGVIFLALLNAVTSGSVLSLQAQDSAASGGPFTNVTNGGTATLTDAGTNSNKTLILDLVGTGPLKQYVQCLLNRTTQNTQVDGMLAILYRCKQKPTTLDASVALSALLEPTS